MLDRERRFYDEFILYADHEFDRLFGALEEAGILDNTWIIFTSDHGELLERGKKEHMLELLYMPLVQIPLIVFAPGQTRRQDIYTPTSAADILPSLLGLTGKSVPPWIEGEALPTFRPDVRSPDRSIFALDAREVYSEDPLDRYTAMILKEGYKLHYYHGYPEMAGLDRVYELFNVAEDPEEMVDLSGKEPEIAMALLAEVQAKVQEADAPYQRG
jgi:arylsulfatase A-like enzyme